MTVRICATASLPPELRAEAREGVCQALAGLADAVAEISHAHAAPHLEGSLGAGDLTWDFAVPDATALGRLRDRVETEGWRGLFDAAPPAHAERLGRLSNLEAWRIEPIAQHVTRDDLRGIKRTNLVRVLDAARPEEVGRWSRDVMAFPDHVPAIRNWSLARTHAFGPSRPRVAWTHAWEQEFETLEGLAEDYMASPYHWGYLDGWYDPEMPHCIMDPDLAHLFCDATKNVLGWTKDAPSQAGPRAT